MTTTVIVLVALAAGAGVAVYLVKRSKPVVEEGFYYYKCPGCKRKIGYRKQQVGHKGACRRCRQQFVFPPLPDQPAV
jgi:hypothetical protein